MNNIISSWLIFISVFTIMINLAYGSSIDAGTSAQVIIVPGYKAAPKDHWFSWLSEELSEYNITSRVLDMPSPSQPNLLEWIDTLEKAVAKPESNVFIVAHSLGAHAVLHWLSNLPKYSELGGAVLVSPFLTKLPALPELDPVVRRPQKFRLIEPRTNQISVIAASDDYLVPSSMSEEVARELRAEFISLKNGGHFLALDGFSRFPTVLEKLLKLIEQGDFVNSNNFKTSDTQP